MFELSLTASHPVIEQALPFHFLNSSPPVFQLTIFAAHVILPGLLQEFPVWSVHY